MARRSDLDRAVSDLPFVHGSVPGLGCELITLSSLYERARRGTLPHALDVPQRPTFHMIYVGIAGSGTVFVDFEPVSIAAGLVTVVASGRTHSFDPRAKVDAWMLLFTPEMVPGMPSILWPIDEVPVVKLPKAELSAVLATIEQIDGEQRAAADRELLATLVRAVVLRIERHHGAPARDQVLRRFFTIVERDFAKTRNVAHYAKQSRISPRRLGELVHGAVGRSPKQIVDERVVREAKRALAHGDVSIKELAAALGFDEATNFVKFFKRLAGVPPETFRRNLPSSRRS